MHNATILAMRLAIADMQAAVKALDAKAKGR